MGGSFCYNYCLCGTLNLAGSADDARIIVNNYGLLSFVALYVLKLKYRNGAHIHTDRVPVTFVQINYNSDHDLTPIEDERVLRYEVISSRFAGSVRFRRLWRSERLETSNDSVRAEGLCPKPRLVSYPLMPCVVL